MKGNTAVRQYSAEGSRDILFKAQALAETALADYYAKEKTDSSCGLLDISDVVAGGYNEELRRSGLFRFLSALDEEQVKVVQAVMYIGRDDYMPDPPDEELEEYYERQARDPDFEWPDPPFRAADPDAWLSGTIDELGRGKGWRDKFHEIGIIMDKLLALPDYLRRGCQVLGLQ